MGRLIYHCICKIFSVSCDKFQKGIRENFLSFQGGLSKMYRKILNSDQGDLQILLKVVHVCLKEISGLISGSLPEDQGGFTCMVYLPYFFYKFSVKAYWIVICLILGVILGMVLVCVVPAIYRRLKYPHYSHLRDSLSPSEAWKQMWLWQVKRFDDVILLSVWT